jgi:hypothetical protein
MCKYAVQSQAPKKDIPDMNDIINDPMQALTKGWSLLSVAAVEGAKYAAHGAEQFTKYANDNYVRPASQQLADPNLRNNVSAYVSNLTKKVNRKHLKLSIQLHFDELQQVLMRFMLLILSYNPSIGTTTLL